MSDICSIPLHKSEGTYGAKELSGDAGPSILFDYEDYGEIVSYDIPQEDGGRETTLYGIDKEEFLNSLRACYDELGQLKKIETTQEEKPVLLYYYLEDAKEAKRVFEEFAKESARNMADVVISYKEKIARVFLEYFDDGECVDVHAKVGYDSERLELMEDYPDEPDIADSCGDYSSDNIDMDCIKLRCLLNCAGEGDTDLFRYFVELVAAELEERISGRIDVTDDFKFLCGEYD